MDKEMTKDGDHTNETKKCCWLYIKR